MHRKGRFLTEPQEAIQRGTSYSFIFSANVLVYAGRRKENTRTVGSKGEGEHGGVEIKGEWGARSGEQGGVKIKGEWGARVSVEHGGAESKWQWEQSEGGKWGAKGTGEHRAVR
jgi:hypothetical protein